MQACATKPARNDAILMIAKIVMSRKFRGGYSFFATNSVYQKTLVTCVRRLRLLDRRSVRYFRGTGDALKEEEMRA
jgi:hypothetical protein